MPALGLGDAVVHALRVSLERGARLVARGELGPLALCGAEQPELELETVAVQGGFADHLREPALALAAQQIHLEQAELGMHVTGGQEKVVVGRRDDVGGAAGLEHDVRRLLQAGQVERLAAVGGGVGGHGPGAGDRIEGRAERRQRAPETDEAQEEDRDRDERGRAEVDQLQGAASLADGAFLPGV